MKTVIAGTDFSKSSINACRYAAMLASKLNCKLILFNLFEAPVIHSNMGLYGYSYTSVRKESENKTFKVVKLLKKEFPKLEINQFVTSGSFKNELQDFIKNHYIAAAVMGLESKHKFSKSIFGSSGTNLIGKIKTPVVIVPQSYIHHKLNKLVLAVDNSEKLNNTSLDGFENIIKKLNSQLELIHVRTEDEFIRPTISSLKINKSKLPIVSISAKDLQAGIKKYALENHTDMIVTINRKHSGFYNFFIESDSKKIAFVAKVPVMVIHE
jgi:nucleotide-binding universal stress UspA family protein